MKYILYVDYRANYKPMFSEYKPLEAKNIKEAIIKADAMYNADTVYLIRIMEKTGKIEKVESDIKVQTYTAIMEKRSTKWVAMDETQTYNGRHQVKHFYTKFCDWYEIA